MNKNNTSTSGLGLSGVLTVVFVVLKLVGVIDWSWWWVISPTLINIGIALIFIIGLAIYEYKEFNPTPKKNKKRGE